MKIRIIQTGAVSPLYSQAIYHGIAEQITSDDDPVLVITQPNKPYICIGLHQPYSAEINVDYCNQHDIEIIRRNVGGGTVLLDDNQLFFQFIFPKSKAPNQPAKLYEYLLKPVLQTYHHYGVPAQTKSLNDIQVSNKKIAGTGAATINNATVLVGNFLFEFDHQTMAHCINSPSDNFRVAFQGLLEENMTTIRAQFNEQPDIKALTEIFITKTQEILKTDIHYSELTSSEVDAIKLAESNLASSEWTQIEGKKLIHNGVKIAAGVYLLESHITLCDNPLIIRIKIEEMKLATIWLESDKPAIHASLIFISNEINTKTRYIDENNLLDLITSSSSHLNTIDSTEALNLAKAICELGTFSPY